MQDKREELKKLADIISFCQNCKLCKTRTHTVPGEGNPNAQVLFVGEGPGHDEDLQGRPFVGLAGQLLDKMLAAISLSRDEVYIANVVKCRPPANRNPESDEMDACIPFLRKQFSVIRPKIVVCLGSVSAKRLIGEEIRITRDRGKWIQKGDIWFLPTYHPAALLRDEGKKREAWKDLQALSQKINELKIGNI